MVRRTAGEHRQCGIGSGVQGMRLTRVRDSLSRSVLVVSV
jgi:hypothetical protein